MSNAHRYGPWAVVTGASDGIGRALAEHLATQGINIVLAARSVDRLRALATELEAGHGIETLVAAVDLSDSVGVDTLVDVTRDLDVGLVVLAAGFGTTGTFLETPLAAELELTAVNVIAVTHLAHVFAGRLAIRGRGGIVLFGSIVGWQGVPGQANYAASKAYVQSLAEGLHDELRPRGVDVLAVAPGPVDSGFGARAGLTMSSATSTEVVARVTLAALGNRRTVIPGTRGKFLTAALLPLPRRIRSLILGKVITGMREPRRARITQR
ncbi:SDR family NAD(P)-dependent oxidoreductase [Mycolicibacterium arenosum]|uniref:SDR family NAD(P)-dependent oxidoreductase n=1 Tax=Mycolicibacterium arenosum TaxID=2952157 RepID=A0ABT1LYI4_9MYCO|nr:SDR family NAD(P)-dependent oxidoreductase [Mycolicibacterium sp. CAU 1645]MCP9271958.1 SDR family NAD(P)-dependent oxidoreductase [Mycolicibacterium sp. CAU 1645]